MATAIHREHFLVTMLKKEISTAEELDLRPLGKVIIFRVKQNLPIIYRYSSLGELLINVKFDPIISDIFYK